MVNPVAVIQGTAEEILELLEMAPYKMWLYGEYGVKALAALGRKGEATRYAEEGRGWNDSSVEIAQASKYLSTVWRQGST